MSIFFLVLSSILLAGTLIPSTGIQHWTVRVFDFIRLQLLFMASLVLLLGLIFTWGDNYFYLNLILGLLAIAINFYFIFPFIGIDKSFNNENQLKLLSYNVLQKNEEYGKFLSLVEELAPNIILTMESNKAWDEALKELDKNYPTYRKIPLENTYGMHFWTNLETEGIEVHYFLSDERPLIEAKLKDRNGTVFKFWGVHPPPPSPTVEKTAKKKNSELMILAKKIANDKTPCIVGGDFNNVCWSKIAKLFANTSGLSDARFKRGLKSTFPGKYKFLSFPLDLVYHSKEVRINRIKTQKFIGSDHLPLETCFSVEQSLKNTKKVKNKEVNQIIKEGKREEE